MYADTETESMRKAIGETNRRRKIQDEYNKAHGIVPKTIIKSVRDLVSGSETEEAPKDFDFNTKQMTKAQKAEAIEKLEKEMKEAAKMLEFEYAAILRDKIIKLRGEG